MILQLIAPCWQKARLEAWFPPPPTLLIPPRQKLNTAMQTICLPLAEGGDSGPPGPHWHHVWGSQVPNGAISSRLQNLCFVARRPPTALGGVYSFSESLGCLCVLVLLLLEGMVRPCLLRQQRGSFLIGV